MKLCYDMSYFSGFSMEEVKRLEGSDDDRFNHSLCALKMARIANGVSQLHGVVSRAMWSKYPGICESLLLPMLRNSNIGQINRFTKDENDETVFDYRKKHLRKDYSKS
jgi:starch phosphorylase